MTVPPRIAAVAPGPPLAEDTFSGTSRALLHALERRGALAAAVDGRPAALALAEKAACIDADLERWKQRYNAGASPVSPVVRRAMSRVASRRAAAAAPDANVLLQMTGYFDPRPSHPGVLRASYHDGNLAGYLRRPDLRIDPRSAGVRRALAYERRLYDAVEVILCMSEGLRRSFVEDFDQPPEKVVTVGAGANVSVPDRPPARDATAPRLLFVGKQFERKGGPTVLAAFERLRRSHPEAELSVVGPTRLDADLPGVVFHGRISREEPAGDRRLRELFERATAFVMPSVYEPLGIALIEAMGHGLPCVASTVGAIPEIVEDGVTGLLVEAGDVDALADRLLTLAGDAEVGRRMGAAGFERYRRLFTWDSVAARTIAAIEARRDHSQ